jgi:radical SAM superfamily enzyme YgiQ (UPF0313 family)
MTQQATRAYQISDIFRSKGVKVVMGGIHATLLPEEAKKHVDSVVIGEAEEIWTTVLEDFSKNEMRPFYRANRIFELTKMLTPRYELADTKKYKAIWIQTSRGCPMDCEFCCASSVYGKKFRYKSIPQVLKELDGIINRWGRNVLISFADDNMFVNRKFTAELLRNIKKLNIRWFAQSDLSIGEDKKMLKLLRESGCAILFIGFESLNHKNLENINNNKRKADYLNKYPKIIKEIQEFGIGVMGSFILGFDDDTPVVFNQLSDFIIENNIFASQISILTPLPGTKLRERLLSQGRILNTPWDNYTFANVNFIPKKMTAKELQEGYLSVYKSIYAPEIRLKKARYFKNIYLNLKN